jgi:hypothetical protein
VTSAKFRSLWLRSNSHLGVKVQIKKITRDDNISRYFPDIAQSISPICISIMPTSLSKASLTGVYCYKVALVELLHFLYTSLKLKEWTWLAGRQHLIMSRAGFQPAKKVFRIAWYINFHHPESLYIAHMNQVHRSKGKAFHWSKISTCM